MYGLVVEIGEGQPKQLSTVELAELPVLWLEALQQLGGQRAFQVLAQQRIRIVLISKSWRRLTEVHILLNLAETDVA